MKQLLNISGFSIAFMMALSSCTSPSTPAAQTEATTPTEATATPAEEATNNVIALEGNDQMQYNKNEFKVAAGQAISLTLKHVGKLEKNVMGHNFVLLKPGTDINAFAQKAVEAKDSDYIPKSESTNIIAHTKLLAGGESDTITFTITEKGTYDFICSFPGHSGMMKGKLIVE